MNVIRKLLEMVYPESSKKKKQYKKRKMKKTEKEYQISYKKTKAGVLSAIFYGHKERRYNLPFTREEFLEYFINDDNFNGLHQKWVNSNYDRNLKPALITNDKTRNYNFDNITMVTKKYKDDNYNFYRYKKEKKTGKKEKTIVQWIKDYRLRELNWQQVKKYTSLTKANFEKILAGEIITVKGWTYKNK